MLKPSSLFSLGFLSACLFLYSLNSYLSYTRSPSGVSVEYSSIERVNNILDLIHKDCGHCLFKDGPYKTTFTSGELDVGTLGEAHMSLRSCKIIISNEYTSWSDEKLYLIVLHEIAHCMGYEHDSGPLGVMSPYLEEVPYISLQYFLYDIKENL